MQKSLTVFILLPVFFLGACNLTSPRDDASVPRQTSTAEASNTQDLDVIGISKKSGPNSIISETSESLTIQETDVWKRIGSGLTLTRDISEKTTASKLAWFTRNQAYLDRVSTRAEPYLYYIVEEFFM